jgi:hypothetical protein
MKHFATRHPKQPPASLRPSHDVNRVLRYIKDHVDLEAELAKLHDMITHEKWAMMLISLNCVGWPCAHAPSRGAMSTANMPRKQRAQWRPRRGLVCHLCYSTCAARAF